MHPKVDEAHEKMNKAVAHMQEEFAGSELQEKVNVPDDPLRGTRVSM